jgi:hypothetical protein
MSNALTKDLVGEKGVAAAPVEVSETIHAWLERARYAGFTAAAGAEIAVGDDILLIIHVHENEFSGGGLAGPRDEVLGTVDAAGLAALRVSPVIAIEGRVTALDQRPAGLSPRLKLGSRARWTNTAGASGTITHPKWFHRAPRQPPFSPKTATSRREVTGCSPCQGALGCSYVPGARRCAFAVMVDEMARGDQVEPAPTRRPSARPHPAPHAEEVGGLSFGRRDCARRAEGVDGDHVDVVEDPDTLGVGQVLPQPLHHTAVTVRLAEPAQPPIGVDHQVQSGQYLFQGCKRAVLVLRRQGVGPGPWAAGQRSERRPGQGQLPRGHHRSGHRFGAAVDLHSCVTARIAWSSSSASFLLCCLASVRSLM